MPPHLLLINPCWDGNGLQEMVPRPREYTGPHTRTEAEEGRYTNDTHGWQPSPFRTLFMKPPLVVVVVMVMVMMMMAAAYHLGWEEDCRHSKVEKSQEEQGMESRGF